MSIAETRQAWRAFMHCTWNRPSWGDTEYVVGVLQAPEGMVILYLDTWQDGTQYFTAETIIDGRSHYLRQKRTKRDYITKRGAQRVARRWLRDLVEETK